MNTKGLKGLSYYRNRTGKPIYILSQLTEIPAMTLKRIEMGKVMPTVDVIKVLADHFDVSFDVMLLAIEDNFKTPSYSLTKEDVSPSAFIPKARSVNRRERVSYPDVECNNKINELLNQYPFEEAIAQIKKLPREKKGEVRKIYQREVKKRLERLIPNKFYSYN
jgi:DNA-binding XRE family transcriptional regulator